MVHVRRVDDRELTFVVSGRLWRNSLIMKDRETGTFWSHVTGEALIGELKGKTLSQIPAVQTTWGEWRKEHPGTLVLEKDESVTSSRYERYFSDPGKTGLFRTEWLRESMPGKDIVYGLTIGHHALAVAGDKLEKTDIVQTRIDGRGVIVVKGSDGGVRAFRARAGESDLSFTSDERPDIYRDAETGSAWNLLTGECTTGKLEGVRLAELDITAAFWFGWSSFYPNTELIE